MKYRNLGFSGLKVSAVGLGANRFSSKVDQKGVNDILAAALDLGINLIDTADVYNKGGSETSIGKAIKGRRDEVIIATKVYGKMGEKPNDRSGSRHHILQGVEASLKRLSTDYIDLYQMHQWDNETPIEETLKALDDLVRQGKVRYIGSSNYKGWQVTQSQAVSEMKNLTKMVSEQPHFHLLERSIEKEILPACDYFGVGLLPYFPLAGGFLTGKYQRGKPAPKGSRGEDSTYVQKYMTDENYDILEKLSTFAEERDHSMGELAHAWLLAHPQVSSVISGATKVEHVKSNAKGADWELKTHEMEKIEEILTKV